MNAAEEQEEAKQVEQGGDHGARLSPDQGRSINSLSTGRSLAKNRLASSQARLAMVTRVSVNGFITSGFKGRAWNRSRSARAMISAVPTGQTVSAMDSRGRAGSWDWPRGSPSSRPCAWRSPRAQRPVLSIPRTAAARAWWQGTGPSRFCLAAYPAPAARCSSVIAWSHCPTTPCGLTLNKIGTISGVSGNAWPGATLSTPRSGCALELPLLGTVTAPPKSTAAPTLLFSALLRCPRHEATELRHDLRALTLRTLGLSFLTFRDGQGELEGLLALLAHELIAWHSRPCFPSGLLIR